MISSPGTTAGILSGSTLSLLATSGTSEGTSSGNSLGAGISVSPVNWISRSSSGISPSSEPSPSAGDSTSAGSITEPGATEALGSEKGSTVLPGATGELWTMSLITSSALLVGSSSDIGVIVPNCISTSSLTGFFNTESITLSKEPLAHMLLKDINCLNITSSIVLW